MKKLFPFLLLSTLFLHPSAALVAQYVHIKVPLVLSDHQHRKTVIYFGIDSYATSCIDPNLGEFELPADRCGDAGLCAYFTDSPFDTADCFGNGLLLDLRGYHSPIQVDDYLVVFATLDYPVTLYWPKYLNANFDSIIIHDRITGSIVSANMVKAESLVVSDPNIQQVLLTASGPRGYLEGVRDNGLVPRTTSLLQNYPNPFNPSTEIRYTLANRTDVMVQVYDIVGRLVGTLVDGIQPPGEHRVTWRPDRSTSGMYYYRLITRDGVQTKAMLFIK